MERNLNPQQREAAEAPHAPLLIVAGAGTGKTTTLTKRLIHLIRGGIAPENICALTFTNKAAGEMLERVRRNIALHGREPYIGTFHSLGASILRREGHLLERTANFVIFDDHDSFDIIKKVVKGFGGGETSAKKTFGKKPPQKENKPAILAQKISRIKNIGPEQGASHTKNRDSELADRAFPLYERRLQENNAFDFDDLIEKVVRVFKKHPSVLQKYREKFSAVLVDEYQDVNPIQYELIRLLAGGHKNLSVVGDDEQLIYGWRYANLETFLTFESDWPGARVIFLEENYRSTSTIIRAASAVSQNNKKRRPKNLWTKNPEGEKISVTEVEDENHEGEVIAAHIENLKFKIENFNIAVLYRTNAQSRAIEQALIRRRIGYRIFGGLKFYERKEVKDIVAILRYASNDKDEVSRDRLLKTFSKKRFETIAQHIRLHKNQPPREFIESLVQATDYLGYLERNFMNFADRQENILELAQFASRFKNLPDLLQEVSLVQATDMGNSREGRRAHDNPEVNLMTIHLSKGLEFDTVFIAGCSEGLLPHARSLYDEDRIEEERRLMYVAMTRAIRNLRISFYDVPSRFLGEIPAELVEFKAPSENAGHDALDEKFVMLE